MRNRAQLIDRALEKLNIVGENRPAYPNEVATTEKGVQPLLEELWLRDIVWIGNPEQIPEANFEHIAVLLAEQTRMQLGLAALTPSADGVPAKMAAENALREINQGRYSGAVQTTEYW